jgi:hypothetical protein
VDDGFCIVIGFDYMDICLTSFAAWVDDCLQHVVQEVYFMNDLAATDTSLPSTCHRRLETSEANRKHGDPAFGRA